MEVFSSGDLGSGLSLLFSLWRHLPSFLIREGEALGGDGLAAVRGWWQICVLGTLPVATRHAFSQLTCRLWHLGLSSAAVVPLAKQGL